MNAVDYLKRRAREKCLTCDSSPSESADPQKWRDGTWMHPGGFDLSSECHAQEEWNEIEKLTK